MAFALIDELNELKLEVLRLDGELEDNDVEERELEEAMSDKLGRLFECENVKFVLDVEILGIFISGVL